jgi:hypothetical protein
MQHWFSETDVTLLPGKRLVSSSSRAARQPVPRSALPASRYSAIGEGEMGNHSIRPAVRAGALALVWH